MAEPDAVPQKSRACCIAGPKKRPHPRTRRPLSAPWLPSTRIATPWSSGIASACIRCSIAARASASGTRPRAARRRARPCAARATRTCCAPPCRPQSTAIAPALLPCACTTCPCPGRSRSRPCRPCPVFGRPWPRLFPSCFLSSGAGSAPAR